MALAALAISALLLISGFIALSPELTADRGLSEESLPEPIDLAGSDLTVRIGTGARNSDNTLTLNGLAGDRAILTRYLKLAARDYPYLHYRIAGRHPGETVYLIWKTTDDPNRINSQRLDWTGDNDATIRLEENPDWQGNVTEIGLDIYGELREQPLLISSLGLSSGGTGPLLATIWTQWTTLQGWTQKSINRQGRPGSTDPTRTEAAAAWAGIAVLLLLSARASRREHPPIIFGVAVLLPWITLDLLWQRELTHQFAETRQLFSGKTMHERHLADQDSEIYSYALRLKTDVLPEQPARIFILHKVIEHNYERLKTQYYLLPHNIYNYGRTPPLDAIRPGDFVLVLGDIPGLRYQQALGQLQWGKAETLPVTLVDEDKMGMLLVVKVKNYTVDGDRGEAK
mgnify:FL=1